MVVVFPAEHKGKFSTALDLEGGGEVAVLAEEGLVELEPGGDGAVRSDHVGLLNDPFAELEIEVLDLPPL